jgi:hypothetical protein
MILPTKHIKLSNSLLGVGATLLKYLDRNRTVTSLWNETYTLPEIKTFDRFTLGLDFLFLVGVIDFQDGLLRRVKK